MAQKNGVLTREDNRISLDCAKRATMQEDYQAVMEQEMPVDRIEQTWIFEIGEKARVARTTPKFGSFLVEIIKWLYHLGSGRIDDSLLEARYKTPHNIEPNGMGL